MWDDLEFQDSIKELKKAGPEGHVLAHITPEEADLLKVFGGSGRIDPNTKLPSFEQLYYNSYTGKWETKEEREQGMSTTQNLGNRDWKEWQNSIDKWGSRLQDWENPITQEGQPTTFDSGGTTEWSTGDFTELGDTSNNEVAEAAPTETTSFTSSSNTNTSTTGGTGPAGSTGDVSTSPDDDDTDTFDSNTGLSSDEFNDSGFDSAGNYDYGSDVTGTQGMNAEDYHNMMTGNTGNSGDDSGDRERKRKARERAAKLAEEQRQARIAAGKKKLNELLDAKKKGYEYDEEGNEINAQYDIYMKEFQDDLEEDYSLAQGGLDRSFLEGGDAHGGFEEWSGENALNFQQEDLTDYLETEQGNLETQAADYQGLADADLAAWYLEQQEKISGIDTEIDWDNWDFSELDLSGYDDPTQVEGTSGDDDPLFFSDYRHFSEDPAQEEQQTNPDTTEAEGGETESGDSTPGTVVEESTVSSGVSSGAPKKKKKKGSGYGTSTTSRSSSRVI